MMNETDETVAKRALALPREVAGVDDQGDDGTALYHLLRSLLEFCDHRPAHRNRIDFDAVLFEVREDFNR